GDGDAEDADGKLHKAERIIQPRHRTVGYRAGAWINDRRGEVGIDEDIDLHGGGADDCRAHETNDLAHARVADTDIRPIGYAAAFDARPLNSELEKSANDNTVSHAGDGTEADGWTEQETQQQSADDG